MTTKTKRNDPHAAANLIPSDYTHVLTFAHAGTEAGWPVPAHGVDVLLAMKAERQFFNRHGGCNRCDVCGANFRFGDVFEHGPTGVCIVVGWECGDKIATLDRSVFDRELGAVREATLAEARKAAKATARAEFLAAHEGLAEALQGDHYILRDIAARFELRGELSEAQVELVFKIARELRERAAEVKVPVAIANGERATVRGRVVSVKWVDGFRGDRVAKATVKVDAAGGVFLLYGTLPRGIANAQRGDVVEFAATIEHGDRDPSFGFFSRPTGAKIVAG